MKALIIVDLQNDFLPGGPLEVAGGDEIIPVVNRLAEQFELVVATRDWHPANHGSFAIVHAGHQEGETIELNGLSQMLWPVHGVQDTPGAQFPNELNTDRIERVFSKGEDPGVDSYSGFFANGRRKATGLADYLRSRGVDEVYIVGLALDVCVRATALDAVELGFETHVAEDATRAVNMHPEDGALTLNALRDSGVRVVRSDEIVR